MKSMEAKINDLTSEIKQFNLREFGKKIWYRHVHCYECNKEGHIKRNCPNVKKRPCENEHN